MSVARRTVSERDDTIGAVATAPGQGGIGIVRMSGPGASTIAATLFVPKQRTTDPWPAQKLIFGAIASEADGRILDEGYAVRMGATASYTGEDVVELHAHGSPVTLQKIVECCIAAGARLARAGEFTQRAYLNGKLDLIQAEAVAELIAAQSEAEAAAARRRLEGRVSGELNELRENVVSLLAECEADVDFPEEDLTVRNAPTLLKEARRLQAFAEALLTTYRANQRLASGFSVLLVGRPNVGKSCLFNALLSSSRAIVTSVPGTTRDVLREELVLEGRRVRLIDSAGLREGGGDEVEGVGMARTRNELQTVDRVCVVLDAQEGLTREDEAILEEVDPEKRWVIWNKKDLRPPPVEQPLANRTFSVSALTGADVEALRSALGEEAAKEGFVESNGGISNDRQRERLAECAASLGRGVTELKRGASPEFVAFEFRGAHRALSRLVGRDAGAEDVLSDIFSRFCIGK